jgi:hypothetical protein
MAVNTTHIRIDTMQLMLLRRMKTDLEMLISIPPTGDVRNSFCDLNILTHECEKKVLMEQRNDSKR